MRHEVCFKQSRPEMTLPPDEGKVSVCHFNLISDLLLLINPIFLAIVGIYSNAYCRMLEGKAILSFDFTTYQEEDIEPHEAMEKRTRHWWFNLEIEVNSDHLRDVKRSSSYLYLNQSSFKYNTSLCLHLLPYTICNTYPLYVFFPLPKVFCSTSFYLSFRIIIAKVFYWFPILNATALISSSIRIDAEDKSALIFDWINSVTRNIHWQNHL